MWLAFGSSAAIVVGIAPSQILLGLTLLAFVIGRVRPEVPPIKAPLGLFLLGTAVAIALSGDPGVAWPQVKKFYVFTQVVVAYTVLRELRVARRLMLAWAVLASVSGVLGIWQFGVKLYTLRQQSGDLYTAQVAERITGFMSHWYTFSVVLMIALLMLVSYVFFAPGSRRRLPLWCLLGLILSVAIVIAQTRAVWVATVVAGAYLVFVWRPKATLAIPVVLGLGLMVTPPLIRQRAISIVRPSAADSNEFRSILMRTGVRMVKEHPWFGLGPEVPRKRFLEYLPPDVPLPLPAGSYMHLHNVYLHYAAERGVPVMLVMVWLFAQILWDFGRGVRALPAGLDDRRFLLHGGIAVVISLLIEGITDVNLGDSEVLTMFLVVTALGYNALGGRLAADRGVPLGG
ncbi:MAG TPA: O-antigen ligase family protein [Bryobacteraceae bacterium]|nr:O-antigen ligase family protein [Bryobacteraceae bacterium]